MRRDSILRAACTAHGQIETAKFANAAWWCGRGLCVGTSATSISAEVPWIARFAAPLAEHLVCSSRDVTWLSARTRRCAPAPRTRTPLRRVAEALNATGTRGPRVHVAPAGAAALHPRPLRGRARARAQVPAARREYRAVGIGEPWLQARRAARDGGARRGVIRADDQQTERRRLGGRAEAARGAVGRGGARAAHARGRVGWRAQPRDRELEALGVRVGVRRLDRGRGSHARDRVLGARGPAAPLRARQARSSTRAPARSCSGSTTCSSTVRPT